MPQQFYEEDEAAEILRLAAQQRLSGRMDRNSLLQAAAEVGISEAAVEAAEREMASSRGQVNLAGEFKVRQRTDYLQLLMIFGAIWLFLIGIWAVTSPGEFFWPIFPIMGMGIGAVAALPSHLMEASSAYQDAFESWKRKRAKREARATLKALE